MISSDNIAAHELIGLHTEIAESTNPQILGLRGVVVDETKHMFTIQTKNGKKMIPKKENKLNFLINSGNLLLSGTLLEKRAYERLVVRK